MMKQNETPNYYAVIPANVRYNKQLKANAKLLYGEITSLSNVKGFCYAKNQYFAKLYDVSKETISRWISQLIKAGYITSELIYKEGTREVSDRYLKISTPIDKNVNTPPQKNQYPIDKKINTPIDKNVKVNNTSINNTSINNKESIEKKHTHIEVDDLIKQQKKEKEKKVPPKKERFSFSKGLIENGFKEDLVYEWLLIRKKRKAINSERALKSFITKIERTKKDKNEILIWLVEKQYKGFEVEWYFNYLKQKKGNKKETKVETLEINREKLNKYD